MPSTKTSSPKKKALARAGIIKPVVETEEVAEEQSTLLDTDKPKPLYLYVLLTVAIFASGMLAGFVVWGYKPAPKPTIYNIDTKGFPSLGPADAPVVIVEYSDFQCPYCYRAYESIYKPLLAAYPGKIRFVYRNFPLSFHPNSMASAEAALCAGDQNAYWEMHNTLFDSYVSLYQEDQGRILDQATYNKFAGELGLDVATFQQCMTSEKYKQFILDDVAYANALPADKVANECGEAAAEAAVGGTPTFFVNGHRIGGLYPIEEFRKIIDAELAK